VGKAFSDRRGALSGHDEVRSLRLRCDADQKEHLCASWTGVGLMQAGPPAAAAAVPAAVKTSLNNGCRHVDAGLRVFAGWLCTQPKATELFFQAVKTWSQQNMKRGTRFRKPELVYRGRSRSRGYPSIPASESKTQRREGTE
jgi:hypothetical protein